MSGHPYRDRAAPSAPKRAKAEAWAIAVVLVWVASATHAIAVLFYHALAGPVTGVSITVAVLIPVIAVNARVLATGNRPGPD